MKTKKKEQNNFKRNLFFFFLFIVLAGITFYPLDQRQSYEPTAQTPVEPTFGSIADCTANQNCPSGMPSEMPIEPAPSGTVAQPTGGSNDTLINELISLIRQLIALLGGGDGGCPTEADDVRSASYYDETDTGLVGEISAYTQGKKKWGKHKRGHRHWKKWHKKHHKGLWKRVKCKDKKGGNQPGGQTPAPSTAPEPSDAPAPSDMPEPTDAQPQPTAQPACGQPGNQGNSQGVGRYCTKGGGECQGTQSPYCALDFKTGVPGICSKPCASDNDCGEAARCSGSGLEKGCEPTACNATQ